MSVLSIDIETYSEVDLPKCGVYAYTDHPNDLKVETDASFPGSRPPAC